MAQVASNSSTSEQAAGAQGLQFLLNDKLIHLNHCPPTQTVLQYLRTEQNLVGSKEGCAEGDCGACTVVLGELNHQTIADERAVRLRAANACIQFMPTLDGKALYTVEYLRQASGELHPVQQAMVDCNGSQCGFCTPGFVMSLWSMYLEHQANNTQPSDIEVRTALSGNLCRCTGYKPILQAGQAMFDLPSVNFDHVKLGMQLNALQREEPMTLPSISAARIDKNINDSDVTYFYAPKNLAQLITLRTAKPEATVLAGGTDVGLWVTKQLKSLGDIIYIGQVTELHQLQRTDQGLHIGAAVNLSDALQLIAKHYPQINEQWQRFASVPVRNAGTLGGNVANGSPIGDSMPWLIVLGAQVHLTSERGERHLPLEDLYVDYMQKSMHADEIITAITLPLPKPLQRFATHKLSKRYDSDISAVCAAFAIELDHNNMITDVRIAFGGIAAIPKRATKAEATLNDQPWSEASVQAAMQALAEDYAPLSDMRASAQNRAQSAANLLYRFYLETRTEQPLSVSQLSVFNHEANT